MKDNNQQWWFPSILGLIFITLKLAGIGSVAHWSWWAVLSPFWLSFVYITVVTVWFMIKLARIKQP